MIKYSRSLLTLFLAIALIKPAQVSALSAKKIGEIARQITVQLQVPGPPGSGVIIAKENNTYSVLTAAHVVSNIYEGEEAYVLVCKTTQTNCEQKQRYSMDVSSIRQLQGIDLAIVQFNSSDQYKTALIGNSKTATELTQVIVGGYQLPGEAIQQSVFQITRGEITSRGYTKDKEGYNMIYDNTTMKGMSGGPVLNEKGELIGINGKTEGEVVGNEQIPSGFSLGIAIQTFLDQAKQAGIAPNWRIANSSSPPTEQTAEEEIQQSTSSSNNSEPSSQSDRTLERPTVVESDPNAPACRPGYNGGDC